MDRRGRDPHCVVTISMTLYRVRRKPHLIHHLLGKRWGRRTFPAVPLREETKEVEGGLSSSPLQGVTEPKLTFVLSGREEGWEAQVGRRDCSSA